MHQQFSSFLGECKTVQENKVGKTRRNTALDNRRSHEFAHLGRLGRGGIFASFLGSSNLLEPLMLGLFVLWLVLHQKLAELSGLVLVECLRELVDARGDFQPLREDLRRKKM